MRNSRGKPKARSRTKLRFEALEPRMMFHAGATLSGFVYLDADGDGARDAAEVGVPGAVVRLTGNDSTGASVDRSVLTDNNGLYSLGELNAGTYQLSEQQPAAVADGQDSTNVPGAVAGNDQITNLVLADDANFSENNFGERSLRPEFVSIAWFFASSPPAQQMFRETVARGEERAGNTALAASIRAGGNTPGGNENVNDAPTAIAQTLNVVANTALPITLTGDDGDAELQQTLSFRVQTLPTNGTLRDSTNAVVTAGTTLPSANLTYTANAGFTGSDSFTFVVMDNGGTSNGGQDTSSSATVSITVIQQNQPFGAVTPGVFNDPSVLGTRTDLVTGAPAITQNHVSTAVNYSGHSNPPTYGDHHGVVRDSSNNFITPRPTGVYTTEQPDEDLVHNLEHGHVWISYNPTLLSSADKTALEQLVVAGGTDTGVILTPRSQNTSAIALASWAHLLTLNSFDAAQIRNFVEANRGHSPEGFIPSGQRSSSGTAETVDDGLLHTRSPLQPFGAVTPGSANDAGVRGTRTDLLTGAPPVTQAHVTTAVNYTGFTSPPTYGNHHGVIRDAQNNFITPRPTGVYTTEQPDEDLIHNVEHGHVWISYNPTSLSATDRSALEQLVTAGGTNTGVILTPRSENTSPIMLSSWTRQLTLNTFNAVTIRDFIEANRGKSPEGFIPSGQKPANGETLDDGLPHTP